MQQSLAFLVRNKSALIFYLVFISLLFVHSMDAVAQQEFRSFPTSQTLKANLLTRLSGSSCGYGKSYTASELSSCIGVHSACDDDDETCTGVTIDYDTCSATFTQYSSDAYGNPTSSERRLSVNGCTLTDEPAECSNYNSSSQCYVPSGIITSGFECAVDYNCDGNADVSGLECENGNVILPGLGCNDEYDTYYCDSGEIVHGGISACDTVQPGDGIGFECYDGSFAISSAACPEFTGDETNPSAEPNGVCEGNNYSQFSTDPDCNAPVPSPCPENTVCDADSTDPNADHDGDGVSNSNDADADSDGDGIPNGIDTDADGDGIPNHQDGDYSGFTGQGGTWVDSDGDGFHDGYQDGTGDGEGEGEGEEESEEPTTGNSSGSCDSPPQCSDDSVDCAILRQAWENLCPNVEQGELGGLTDEESAVTIESSIDRFTFRVQNTPIVAGLTNYFTLPPGAGCPTWSVSTGWVDITIDQFCSESIPWSIIYGIMIASASFGAAMIAFAGRGG